MSEFQSVGPETAKHLCISLFWRVELQGHPEQLNGGDHDWLIQTPVSTVPRGTCMLVTTLGLCEGFGPLSTGSHRRSTSATTQKLNYEHHSPKCHWPQSRLVPGVKTKQVVTIRRRWYPAVARTVSSAFRGNTVLLALSQGETTNRI